MAEKASDTPDRRRILVGAAAVILGLGAALTWWQGQPETASVLLRAGVLLAAVWLAYPSLRSTRWGVWLAVAGGALLLLTRLRVLAAVVIAGLGLALVWGRIRGRGASRR